MLEKQDTRRLNTAELILPAETGQEAVLPSVMPKSPLDWPVEMFTQALDRREVSRDHSNAQRITAKQHKFIMSLCLEQGISKAQIKQHCLEAYGAVVNYLTRADASSLIEHLLIR